MRIKSLLLLCIAAMLCSSTFAHDRYILPSHTVLSGDAPQSVTFSSSISNDVFHPDRALGDNGKGVQHERLKGLFAVLDTVAILPNGEKQAMSWQAFTRQSVADLQLTKSGTYRVCIVQPQTKLVTFTKADGSHGRVYGGKGTIPTDASDIVRRTTSTRVETYVTLNEPNQDAFKPMGQGLELTGDKHPNDLFTNEATSFQLVYNGKPVGADVEVTLVRGGTRHRNARVPHALKTNSDGVFEVTFNEPGFYLLHSSHTQDGAEGSDVDKHHNILFVTLEVFPE